MNTLFKVFAGITLLTLLVLPVTGVLAACGDGVLDGTETCEPPGTATCNTSCQTITAPAAGTPAAGTPAAGTGIGGIDPAPLPSWTPTEVMHLVTQIVNWVFTFLMLFVVIMVLVAGFTFVTGGGNPDNVTKARNMLMYALVGFAVGMLARGIIALVQAFLGKTIENPF